MTKITTFFIKCVVLLLFIFPNKMFSINTGKIKGKINYPNFDFTEKSKIVLKENTSNSTAQIITVNEKGEFTIIDIPFSSYNLEYYEADLLLTSQDVIISSNMPKSITLNVKTSQSDNVIVEANYFKDDFKNSITGGKTFYSAKDIQSMPNFSNSKQIETIILNSAGAVPDEDGRMHIRGEDAQLQYVIDGIPVFSNQTRIYSSLFNSSLIKSVDFLRGGLNAEYGVAASGVLNINTQSGFDRPVFAQVFGQNGSFQSSDLGFEVGGNIYQKAALFIGYTTNTTNRYLDPIAIGDPINNQGKNQNLFTKANFILSDKIDMVLIGSYAKTNFQIPNSFIGSKQSQKQDLTNSMFGFRINSEIAEQSILSLVGYMRNDLTEISSNGLNKITNSNDSITALQNEKFFMGGRRENKVMGGIVEFSTKLFENDNFKSGAGVESYPRNEYFSFAVTNSALSTPDSSGGDERYQPYDITRAGGKPFVVNQKRDGDRYFGYIQDVIPYQDWNFSFGLRYDYYNLFVAENNLSIRLGANYKYDDKLNLRFSFNRVVMQSPLENILVSSSDEAALLTGTAQKGIDNRVKSEKSNVLEIGASYVLDEYLTFDLAGYSKLIDDFIVKVELGNSGVIFPVNLKNGFVAGGELQIKLNNWNNFSGFLNFSTCASFGIKPEDGSSPISSGLILGEEGKNYSNPFAGEDMFPTEHNQLLTASFNLSYKFIDGINATIGGRFDSGLPFDLVDSTGQGLDAEQSRIELKRRGYSDEVIDMLSLEPEEEEPGSPDKSVAPHAVFDFAVGFDFRKLLDFPVKLTLSAMNILDTAYLYKFESSFGGTHFGTPRMINLRADIYSF